MEYTIGVNRNRGRKRKRRVQKQRREQIKLEVKALKRQKFMLQRSNASALRDKTLGTMQADAFWKNYVAAEEWQKRHNVTWWRTRCFALEQENEILRNKLRSLIKGKIHQDLPENEKNEGQKETEEDNETSEADIQQNEENFEFHVNEDMLSFLEQSIRHKMELKQKRESESASAKEIEAQQESLIEYGATWVRVRNNNAKLLYGEGSPRILAMETALQVTMDRHKDIAKPQYWPNIPLKP